jgi:ankyrin repeat protein
MTRRRIFPASFPRAAAAGLFRRRPGRAVRTGTLAAVLFCGVGLTGGAASADDYDWSRPGTSETEAVISAIEKGDTAGLEALLNDGLDVDELLPDGQHRIPPISIAAAAGQVAVIEYLLAQGADVDRMSMGEAVDKERFRDRYKDLGRGERGLRPQVTELTLDNIEDVTYASPLMYAVTASSRKGTKVLLQAEADVDMANSGSVTALMIAAALKDRVLVNLLLAFGASVDDQAEDLSYLVPPGCREESKTSTFRLWNPKTGVGATALWLSAFAGGADVVERLLSASGDPELKASCKYLHGAAETDEFCTPRRAAELGGHPEVMALLP